MRAEFGAEKDKQSSENDYAVETIDPRTYYNNVLHNTIGISSNGENNSVNCVWTSWGGMLEFYLTSN